MGNQILRDQFEWDMSEPSNDPETFARSTCADLALGPEYISGIALAIREQLNEYASELLRTAKHQGQEMAVTAGKAIRDPNQLSEWEPSLDDMTEDELQQTHKDEAREERIRAREARKPGGGRTSARGAAAPAAIPATQMIGHDSGAVMENFRKARMVAARQAAEYDDAPRLRKKPANPFGRGGQPAEYIKAKAELATLQLRRSELKRSSDSDAKQQIDVIEAEIDTVDMLMIQIIEDHKKGGYVPVPMQR